MSTLTTSAPSLLPSPLPPDVPSLDRVVGNSKPVVILVNTEYSPDFVLRWGKVLTKMGREARLYTACNLGNLNTLIEQFGGNIAGFVIADANIMNPCFHDLSLRLSQLPGHGREWPVNFAFDFPSQAVRQPLLFSRYIDSYYGLDWKISGQTTSKIKLAFCTDAIRVLSPRNFRWDYEIRCVFIRNVDQDDKILVATGEFPPTGQRVFDGLADDENPEIEYTTESTAIEFGSDDEGPAFSDSATPTPETVAAAAAPTPTTTEDGDSIFTSRASRVSTNTTDTEMSDGFFFENFGDAAIGGNEDVNGNANGVEIVVDVVVEDGSLSDEGYGTGHEQSSVSSVDTEQEDYSGDEADDEMEDGEDDDHDHDYYHPDVHTYTTTTAAAAEKEEPNDPERHIANCSAAIHAFPAANYQVGDNSPAFTGFVGFLGHVGDNRSMASVLLGMCGIPFPGYEWYLDAMGNR